MVPYEYVVTYFESLGFFCVVPFFFPSLAFLASFKLCATMLYSFVINPMLIMPSFVPRYFGFSDSSSVCFTAACHLNIRKNGAIPEDSVGKKLCAAVTLHTRSSHSMRVSSCFAIVALRNLSNPSILLLHVGRIDGCEFLFYS